MTGCPDTPDDPWWMRTWLAVPIVLVILSYGWVREELKRERRKWLSRHVKLR